MSDGVMKIGGFVKEYRRDVGNLLLLRSGSAGGMASCLCRFRVLGKFW